MNAHRRFTEVKMMLENKVTMLILVFGLHDSGLTGEIGTYHWTLTNY